MARSTNGGIIGKSNKASFGKDTVTSTTPTGSSTVTLQSGTRVIDTLIVAGGGSGGGFFISGGGGGGGFRTLEAINAQGCVTATIGAGGTGGGPLGPSPAQGTDGNDDWQAPITHPTITDDGADPVVWRYWISWNETKYQADNSTGWEATKSNDESETPTKYNWDGTAWVSE